MEEAPWGDLRGKELDARKLAQRLKVFGVTPSKWRAGEATARGYLAADFADVWSRYLSPHRAPQPPQAPQALDSDSPRVADVAVVAANTDCTHRREGEAEQLWDMGEATWRADAKVCACCGAPTRSELAYDADSLCPPCRAGAIAPERGGHLVRLALDLGGRLVAPAAV